MENVIDRVVVEGKTARNALVAVFALVVGATAMPSFAAERTVSGAYTLTANEDWTGDSVTLERGATVDLAGHNLAVGVVALGSGSGTATFTDSSAGTGELRFTIPSGATFTKTADIAITGSLALVKDGPGTLLWNGGTLDAAIPITISGGVFKNGVTTANVFGSSGTITVNGTGQFDLNFRRNKGGDSPVLNKTFYIEGDGPDGSGAIVNTAVSGGYAAHLSHVYMTGDATIGGTARVECRGEGYGISGAGYTLTVKNTECLVLTSATTASPNYLTCQKVICDGGTLQPCQVASSATVTLTITEGVTLKNGGKFDNYAYKSGNRTQIIAPSITVSEGGGTLHSSQGWYQLNGPLTVQTGSTLSIPTDAPWYYGAITNETGATLNVSGEFNACGGIFRNDGTLNHTAGLFVFGHRDGSSAPCAVENNGTVLTSGGTFQFNANSSMTGTGTLDLAGGTPSVAGTISGFNGTIRVSGGTATIANIATFPGTLALADGDVSTSLAGVTCGVVFDLSGKSVPFTIPASWLTLPSAQAVTVNLAGREVSSGEPLIAWSKTPDLVFSLDATTAAGGGRLLSTADGLYYAEGDVVITSATWTGAANDGDFSNSANWSCLDPDGNPVAGVVPTAGVTVTLGADVVAAWSSFDLTEGRTIDLNGHRLVLNPADGSAVDLVVIDTSVDAEHPGELRFTVGADATFTSTEDLSISGNLSLVKDGPGTFVWGGGTLAATIPVSVTGGVFRVGVATANVFGAGGDIYVSGIGQFDININSGNAPTLARTFHIEGDGPDGSGAIVNSASGTSTGYHLGTVILTGDATIGGTHRIDFRRSGDGLNGGGHSLTIKNTACLAPCGSGTYMTNLVDIVVSDNGVFQPCSGCTLGASGVISLVNGGVFANWSDSGVTQGYDIPIVVGAGGGTVRSDAYWYMLNESVTVESGNTLTCTKDGPWYKGNVTNQANATISISCNFYSSGNNTFVNNGLVSHTAGELYFGDKYSQGSSAVENNGTIRTTGGTFVFDGTSSMTGTGALQVDGGAPSLAGDFSGFTGTITLNGGTTTYAYHGAFPGSLTVNDGATLKFDATGASSFAALSFEAGSALNLASASGVTPFAVASLTLPASGTVALTRNGGAFPIGIYPVYSRTGVTTADGDKFAVSDGGLGYSWEVQDGVLVLCVGDVHSYTWTGNGGDNKMSNPENWAGGSVPAADGPVDFSSLSSAATIDADTDRTFGTVTMGTGVVTFTNSFTAASFVNASGVVATEKVAVAPDSTVTIDGDLTFSADGEEFICYDVASGGRFEVTGHIILTHKNSGNYLRPNVVKAIAGVIAAKGLVNNRSPSRDSFQLARPVIGGRTNWEIGEDGFSGSCYFYVPGSNNPTVNITASTNFMVAAGIGARSSNGIVLNTAGWTVAVGDGTSGYIDGAGPLTVTGGGAIAYNTDSALTGTLTIASGTTLEVPKSSTVKLSGALDLEAGAILAFNFTNRLTVPCLDLNGQTTGDISEDITQVTVRVSSECGRPAGGEKTLVTGYDFTGEPAPALDAGKPQWVRNISVNEDTGNLVLDVKPMGTVILFR